jgi:hypothetical protein
MFNYNTKANKINGNICQQKSPISRTSTKNQIHKEVFLCTYHYNTKKSLKGIKILIKSNYTINQPRSPPHKKIPSG